MTTEASAPPRDWREYRRLRALALHEDGWCGRAIAEVLGVSQTSVSAWLKKARVGGRSALRTTPPPGRVANLTAEQRATVPALLAKGAEAYGFIGDLWTTTRVATVI